MLGVLSSISAISGVLGFVKDHKRGLTIFGIVLLLGGVAILYKEYKEAQQQLKQYREEVVINLRASRDASQAQLLRVQSKYERELTLQDSAIISLKDSLDIRDKQVTNLRKIAFSKTTKETVTEYVPVYEFIELDPSIPNKFTVKHDDCITLSGEFTPEGLKTKVERNIEVYDLSYWQRKKLFGWTWTPRIGQKEYYQTLITNCGDTITNNEQITFER